jgi:hypothetical protein
LFEHAKTGALVALDPEGTYPVVRRLLAYYDRDLNYAGASFVQLAPVVADDVMTVRLEPTDGTPFRAVIPGKAPTRVSRSSRCRWAYPDLRTTTS